MREKSLATRRQIVLFQLLNLVSVSTAITRFLGWWSSAKLCTVATSLRSLHKLDQTLQPRRPMYHYSKMHDEQLVLCRWLCASSFPYKTSEMGLIGVQLRETKLIWKQPPVKLKNCFGKIPSQCTMQVSITAQRRRSIQRS